jgi:predicted transglutaminase-like cysteine proteinase
MSEARFMQPRLLTQARFHRLGATLLAGILLFLGLASALANWDFGLILNNAEKRYGNLGAAKQRILAWEAQIKASSNSAEMDKLRDINRFFNRQIRFVDDIRVWRQNDYWATPIEALVKGSGDCEDYSIASDKLRITYVKALNYNQAHMVLTYYASPSAEPLVLDNLINEIKPASQRRDLLPVYAFNAEGLYLPGSNSRKSDSKKLSRWQDLLKKMRTEGFAIGEG